MLSCYVTNNYNYQGLFFFELPEDVGRSRCVSEGISRQNQASQIRGLLPEGDVETAQQEASKGDSFWLAAILNNYQTCVSGTGPATAYWMVRSPTLAEYFKKDDIPC